MKTKNHLQITLFLIIQGLIVMSAKNILLEVQLSENTFLMPTYRTLYWNRKMGNCMHRIEKKKQKSDLVSFLSNLDKSNNYSCASLLLVRNKFLCLELPLVTKNKPKIFPVFFRSHCNSKLVIHNKI